MENWWFGGRRKNTETQVGNGKFECAGSERAIGGRGKLGWVASNETYAGRSNKTAELIEDFTDEKYIKCLAKKFVVVLNLDGGEIEGQTELTLKNGQTLDGLATPTKDGYFFEGWYTEDGEKITEKSVCNKNSVLYAQWSCTHKNICNNIFKATTSQNGKIVSVCSDCGKEISKSKIYYPKTINLSATNFGYTGNVQKPTITVKGSDGKIISSINYTVSYSGDCKSIGLYTATIAFKGSYTGSTSKTFIIVPATTEGVTTSNTTSGVKVGWTKSSQATGYQVFRSTNGGNYSKVATISNIDTLTFSDTAAKANGAKYQYKVRAYKTVSGTTYYGSFSTENIIYYLNRPTISAASNTTAGVKISWGKNTKATGYYIYRSSNGVSYSKVNTITANSTVSYTDTGAKTNGAKYQYKVIAYKTVSDVTYLSPYSAVKTDAYTSKMKISSLKNSASKKMTVMWAKNSKATGYQIQYSTLSSFSNGNKTVTITKNSTAKKAISSLKKGKKYYVRIRAYKTINGTKYYGPWSAKKSVKIT